jgi:hypothetical protein
MKQIILGVFYNIISFFTFFNLFFHFVIFSIPIVISTYVEPRQSK